MTELKPKNIVSLSRIIDNVLYFMDLRGFKCEFYEHLSSLDNDLIYETMESLHGQEIEDEDSIAIKHFKRIYASNIHNALTTEFITASGGLGIVYWSCIPGNNYKKNEIDGVLKYMEQYDVDKLIVISAFDKNYIKAPNKSIELFSFHDFIFNPFTSIYSSKAEIVRNYDELEELRDIRLSIINENDALVRYLGGKVGEILSIMTPTMATKSINKFSLNYRKISSNNEKIRTAKGKYIGGDFVDV